MTVEKGTATEVNTELSATFPKGKGTGVVDTFDLIHERGQLVQTAEFKVALSFIYGGEYKNISRVDVCW